MYSTETKETHKKINQHAKQTARAFEYSSTLLNKRYHSPINLFVERAWQFAGEDALVMLKDDFDDVDD